MAGAMLLGGCAAWHEGASLDHLAVGVTAQRNDTIGGS